MGEDTKKASYGLEIDTDKHASAKERPARSPLDSSRSASNESHDRATGGFALKSVDDCFLDGPRPSDRSRPEVTA